MLRLWQAVTQIHQLALDSTKIGASSPPCFNLISFISDNDISFYLFTHRTKSGGNEETFAAAVRLCSPGKCRLHDCLCAGNLTQPARAMEI